MKISKPMLAMYMTRFTDQLIGPDTSGVKRPAIDKSKYASLTNDLKQTASARGDLEAFKAGIEYVLGNPLIDSKDLEYSHYGFKDAEIREILGFIHHALWSEAEPIPPGGPHGVELTRTPLDDWYKRK